MLLALIAAVAVGCGDNTEQPPAGEDDNGDEMKSISKL
ncbi:Vmc-like lipoprotein signal peptide domain-containing protein [Dethiobacter alkaliphilus]|uniref:Uncharacterized protein n=1 Tax=Dethiobacter alkaliphilus AHT 1 TaxID=555088 RepID=C0GEQ5_DETAL|nr:hypothetical protein DealDRAFT_0964 [Dethiobacter alkaliphilus AHT 1]